MNISKMKMLRLVSGSPSMSDIEDFSTAYRELLDKAEQVKSISDNIFLEVSSPGIGRVVRVPQDLDRFKDRTMLVKYVSDVVPNISFKEYKGVLSDFIIHNPK